jgi:hypothetical protein
VRVTPQAAQALSTDIHIVGGTDDDNGNVMPSDCVEHQNHRLSVEQYDGSEWSLPGEKVSHIVIYAYLVVGNSI